MSVSDSWDYGKRVALEELGWSLDTGHIPYPKEHTGRDRLESVEDAGALFIWDSDNEDSFVMSETYMGVVQ